MKLKFRAHYLAIPVILILFAIIIVPFGEVLRGVVQHIDKYLWFALGIVAYLVIRRLPIYQKNESWFMTTSHELTHAVVGIMFFHKIHSFASGERGGVVWHSGRRGSMFISLAPYCLPIFTFLFMLLRLLGSDSSMPIFDVIIGLTLAFHIHCFIAQTHLSQPDITGNGVVVSFMFIITALVLNTSIILLTITHGLINAVVHLAVRYWDMLLFYL